MLNLLDNNSVLLGIEFLSVLLFALAGWRVGKIIQRQDQMLEGYKGLIENQNKTIYNQNNWMRATYVLMTNYTQLVEVYLEEHDGPLAPDRPDLPDFPVDLALDEDQPLEKYVNPLYDPDINTILR